MRSFSGYRLLGTEERVPRFTEVLELVDGRTPLIIELKSYTRQQELCEKTVELLEGYQGLYCVESFDPRVVRWFKRHHPGIIRGQLMCYKPQEDMPGWDGLHRPEPADKLPYPPHFEAYDFTTRHNVSLRAARRVYGMQEVSWTLRSLEDYRAAKADGCLCIFEKFLPLETSASEHPSFSDLLKQYQTAVCLRAAEPPQGKSSAAK